MENEKLENQKINENDFEKVTGGYAVEVRSDLTVTESPENKIMHGKETLKKIYLTKKELDFLKKKGLITPDGKASKNACSALYNGGFKPNGGFNNNRNPVNYFKVLDVEK